MSFTSWQEFFHMGGYALYVWLSYGLSVLFLGFVIAMPISRHRQLKRDLSRQQRRRDRQEQQAPEVNS